MLPAKTHSIVQWAACFVLQVLALAALLATGCASPNTAQPPSHLPLRYHNAQFGFTFFLPADWKGYSAFIEQWKGRSYLPAKNTTEVTARGPLIVLRHPQWRAEAPRQDIPILVYTREQWEAGTEDKAFPYAGGVIDELWHNEHYVFALYSRYNWAELKGGEEVAKILEQNSAANRMAPLPRPR